MARVSRKISKRAFAELTGFSVRQMSRFIKSGLPCTMRKQKRGGKPVPYFNVDEAMSWLAGKGIESPSGKGEAAASVGGDPAPERSEEEQSGRRLALDMQLFNEMGLLGALERLRLSEFNSARLLLRRIKDGAAGTEIAALERLHNRQLIALRQIEFAALKYRERHGELVHFGQMVGAWERIAIGTKNAVMGIPAACVPRIKHLFADPENGVNEAAKIITEDCRRALLGLPDEIPKGSDSEMGGGDQAESAHERG